MPVDIPHISEVGTKVGSTVAHMIAIGMSAVRLYLRVKKDRVWWDDWLAVTSAAVDVVYMLSLWVKVLDPQYELDGVVYYNTWIYYLPNYFVMWVARMSLWLSLARLYPPQHDARRLAFFFTAAAGVLGALCTVGGVLGCPESHWGLRFQYDHCFTSQALGRLSQYEKISAVVGALDLFFDAIMVGVPVYLLSRMRQIQRKRKIVIIFLCCGGILTLLVTTIGAIVIYGPFAETDGKMALVDCVIHLSTATCLLSANLLIVGTAFYSWMEQWIIDRCGSAAQRVPAPRRPVDGAANITFNSDLTRISTSRSDTLSTVMDDDLDDFLDDHETRPLFWSVQHVEAQEDYELSVERRATV